MRRTDVRSEAESGRSRMLPLCVFARLQVFPVLEPFPTTSATSAMMMNALGSRDTVKSFSSMA